MNPSRNRILSLSVIVAFISAGAKEARAVAGVGDVVVVAEDLTAVKNFAEELRQWTTLIQQTNDQIRRADELIKLVGNPKEIVSEFVESTPDLMAPIDKAVGLETRQNALQMSRELYSLGSVATQTYKDANNVGPTFKAFGREVRRDKTRYTHYIMHEAMNARYKRAVENADDVEKAELAQQKKLLEKLKTAQDTASVAALNVLLATSKQRQDIAQQKAAQAKAELDAFDGQLVVEDARKAEADREWAQNVIEEMRQKALDSYRAQFDSGDPAPN